MDKKAQAAARSGTIRPQFRKANYWTEIFMVAPDQGEVIDWDAADPHQLLAAIVNWTRGGNAVTLGRTSDGGALSLTLLAGGERLKKYAKDADELASLLKALGEAELPE